MYPHHSTRSRAERLYVIKGASTIRTDRIDLIDTWSAYESQVGPGDSGQAGQLTLRREGSTLLFAVVVDSSWGIHDESDYDYGEDCMEDDRDDSGGGRFGYESM